MQFDPGMEYQAGWGDGEKQFYWNKKAKNWSKMQSKELSMTLPSHPKNNNRWTRFVVFQVFFGSNFWNTSCGLHLFFELYNTFEFLFSLPQTWCTGAPGPRPRTANGGPNLAPGDILFFIFFVIIIQLTSNNASSIGFYLTLYRLLRYDRWKGWEVLTAALQC